MYSSSQIVFACLVMFSAMACEPASNASNHPTATQPIAVVDSLDVSVKYDFDKPDTVFDLPSSLDEISGLSYDSSSNLLWAVQDEEGQLYELSPKTGEIEGVQTFWKDGDYEGVEVYGEWVFVTKNTGTLYGFDGDTTIKYNGFIDGTYDIEGLGYLPQKKQLLLSCKASPEKGTNDRAIYTFDIEGEGFLERPFMLVKQEDLQNHILKHQNDQAEDFKKFLAGKKFFSPSAIAVHPLNQAIYILSHQGKLLLVLQPNGAIQHIYKLDKKNLDQPEGMAFNPDGTLYISSEKADADAAKLAVFKMK